MLNQIEQDSPTRGTLVQGLFVLLLLTGPRPSLPAAEQKPHIISVAPLTAKIGDVVRATGEALGQTTVDQLYLTNSTQDVKIGFVEQTETTITFRIPTGIKPGRWALMIHLKAGAGTGLFEQPVKVTVE